MPEKNKIEVDKSLIIWCIETLHKHAMFVRDYSQGKIECSESNLQRHAVMILGVRKKLKKLINYFDQSDLDRNGALYHHVKNLEEKGEAIINKKPYYKL